MRRHWFVLLALSGAGAAMAQGSEVSVSVSAKLWYTDWTTFSYYAPDGVNNLALTQISAEKKLVVIPAVSARYDDFFASISAFPSTQFTFNDGSTGRREEFDANLGYAVLPGLLLTAGYKKVSQSDATSRYRPAGPVIGVSGNAQLSGPWALYGSLGVGWLKTPSGDAVSFSADYRLAELGVAYTWHTDTPVQYLTATGGYRIQIINSKDAFESQDGVDTTQGFTVGVIARF
jgi:hypothetical protein